MAATPNLLSPNQVNFENNHKLNQANTRIVATNIEQHWTPDLWWIDALVREFNKANSNTLHHTHTGTNDSHVIWLRLRHPLQGSAKKNGQKDGRLK